VEHQKPATTPLETAASNFVIQHEFDDVDELAEVARSWDLEMRQLNRGGFEGRMVQVGTGRLQLARSRLRGVIHQHGATPAGLISFAFSATGRIRHTWRGLDVGADDLMVHQPSGEFESVSRADFDIYVVTIGEAALREAADREDADLPSDRLGALELAAAPSQDLQQLRRWCALELAAIGRDPSRVRQPEMVNTLEAEASGQLLRCLSPSLVFAASTRHRRHRRCVDTAIKIARENAHVIHTVEALSRASGASPREIAIEWGFWHMGQFAADYRRQFGELPSETLTREAGG
jgi:AraC family ethanolamine operon transcriptional activator